MIDYVKRFREMGCPTKKGCIRSGFCHCIIQNDVADYIEQLQITISNAAKLNARLMDIIDLASRMKTAAFNHWCEKTPETNGILVDLQFEFTEAIEGLKKDGHYRMGKTKSGQSSINDGGIAKNKMS